MEVLEVKASPTTSEDFFAGFKDWLFSREREEKFDYLDNYDCCMARYAKSLGFDDVDAYGTNILADGIRFDIPQAMWESRTDWPDAWMEGQLLNTGGWKNETVTIGFVQDRYKHLESLGLV